MKAELTFDYQELVKEITDRVIKALTAILSKKQEEDIVFTVESLAEYLHVEPSWVYKQVSLKNIPYFKSGKYIRFKKEAIDRWIQSQTIKPIPSLKILKNSRETT